MAKERTLTSNLRVENVVQKSRPLSLLRSVPFSFGELKILDTYLSRIDSHDMEHRTVTFTKAEYEELMGIGKTNLETLKKYTKGILQKVVEVPLDGGYLQFILFDAAECKKDEYGVPTIELHCTEKAQRLFFDIEQIGYIRYQLRYALALKRQSSYWLYFEVLRERYRIEWTVPLAKLRDEILYLKKEQSYKAFKEFKRAILDPAVKEINEKTDCHIEYETVKRGRTVTAIKFTYTPQEQEIANDDIPGQLSLPLTTLELEKPPKEKNEQLELLSDACGNEFSDEEMDEIIAVLATIPESKLPMIEITNDIWIRRYHYLNQKYTRLQRYAEKSKIPKRFEYFLKMVKDG